MFTEFNYNETAKPQKMEDPIFTYDFESLTTGDVTSIKNWYVSASGAAWAAKNMMIISIFNFLLMVKELVKRG